MKMMLCPRCRTPFASDSMAVCRQCEAAEYDDYDKARDTLERYPDCNVEQLADLSGVSIDCVLRMVDRGMIVDARNIEAPACGQCGKPAINWKKKICAACLHELDTKIQRAIHAVRGDEQDGRMFGIHNALDSRRRKK